MLMPMTFGITIFHNLCLFISPLSRSRLVIFSPFSTKDRKFSLNSRNPYWRQMLFIKFAYFSNFLLLSTLYNLSLTPVDSLFPGSHLFLRRCGVEGVRIWEKHPGELGCKGFLCVAESFHLPPNVLSVDNSNMPLAALGVRLLPYRQSNSEQLY